MGKWHHIVPCHMKLDLNQHLLFKLNHFANIEQETLGPVYIVTQWLNPLNNPCSSGLTKISCFSSQLYDLVLYASEDFVSFLPAQCDLCGRRWNVQWAVAWRDWTNTAGGGCFRAWPVCDAAAMWPPHRHHSSRFVMDCGKQQWAMK